jgi:hypothetical protein
MSGLDVVVYGKFATIDRAVPYFMIAFALTVIPATLALKIILDKLGQAGHSSGYG